MKKSLLYLMTGLLSLVFIPAQLKADVENVSTSIPAKSADAERANALINRLNEINSMDKTHLNSLEKKQLRKEVRSTKKELKDRNGGVYLSVTAVIIIILLLIILL